MDIIGAKTNWSKLRGYIYRNPHVALSLGILLILIEFWCLGHMENIFNLINSNNLYNWTYVFVTVIVTIFLGAITLSYTIFTRRTMWHNALLDVQKEYASAEMMSALQFLWNFYKNDCGKDVNLLVKRYKLKIDIEKEEISKGKRDIKDSFDYYRRLVTHFYFHLADIHKNNILPEKIIFDHWSPIDLDIIPQIIFPLDKAQEEKSGVDEERESRGMEKKERDKVKELYEVSYIWYGLVYPPEGLSWG